MMEVAKKTSFKIALLSLSAMLMSAQAVVATLPLLQSSFTDIPLSSIELLMTIPNLGVILFVMLSPYIVKMIGTKVTLVMGLIIVLITGALPFLIQDYTILLISRFIFGAGIGIINPLAISLITMYYTGDELSKLMGFQGSVSALGSALLSIGAGFLIKYGWQPVFLLYLVALIPLILTMFFLPNNVGDFTSVENQNKQQKEKINIKVAFYAISLFIIYSLFFVIPLKITSFIISSVQGSAQQASIGVALLTISSMVFGIFYGAINRYFKRYTIVLCLSGMGLSMFVISLSQNIWSVFIGIVLMGLFFSMLNPYIFTRGNEEGPKGSNNLISAVLLVGINIGALFAPYILNGFSIMLHSSQDSTLLKLCGIILIIMALSVFLKNLITKSRNWSINHEK